MKYADDTALPEVTDQMLQEALPRTLPFTVVILRPGPKFSPLGPDRDPAVAEIVWTHGKRNFALREAGLMPIVCPVADGSGVTGVSVFDATPEEADRIMSRDPGVQAGVFTYEFHATRAFPGSCLPEAQPAVAHPEAASPAKRENA